MAYNNYSNNRDANKPFEPSIYSPYRMNNGESNVDKTCLTFSMWNKQLKISISPRKENTQELAFDMEHGISCYLNHTKAYMLANELRNFLRDPDTYTGSGVTSGQAIITVSNGKELGSEHPVLIIRKIDETGNVVSSFAYEFKTDYHFSVRKYTGTKEFTRESESYNTLEITQCIIMLEEYYKAMTYALAYTMQEANKYNLDRVQSNLKAIMDKMGIEGARSSSGRGGFNSATNFFNNSSNYSNESNGNYPTATLDDID